MRARRWVSVTVALVAVSILSPTAAAASGPEPALQPHPRTRAAAGPETSAGHFHALATPVRVISTLTGLGVPKKPLGPSSSIEIALGTTGVPATGVRAVSATITAVNPSGATSVWLNPTHTRPGVPVIQTARTTTRYSIVPVTADTKTWLWVGAHATDVTIDVTGWWSDGAEATGAGLFRKLAGRELRTLTVPSGQTRTVSVAAVEDMPPSGAAAALLSVRLSSTAAGSVTIARDAAGAASGTTTASYAPGVTLDLALTRLSAAGSFAVRNAGHASVTVRLSGIGWFTDASHPSAHGDVLDVTPAPGTVLDGAQVGPAGKDSKVAGVHGVPAAAGTEPPSLVAVRVATGSSSKADALEADAAGSTPTGEPNLLLRKGEPATGLVLAAPGSGGSTHWSTMTAAVPVSGQSVAWFAGGLRISPHAHVLGGAALAAIASVSATSIHFNGSPTPLDHVAVGDTIVATSTTTTPDGLLRKVTAVSRPSGNLVLATAQGALADVVLQGSFSFGAASSEPRLPSAAQRLLARRPTTRHQLAGGPCSTDAGFLLGGAGVSVSCSKTFETTGLSATVEGSAAVAVRVSGEFHGLSTPDIAISEMVSTGASLTATANGDGVIDKKWEFLPVRLPEIRLQLGYVPVLIFPYIVPTITLKGDHSPTLNISASLEAGWDAGYSTSDGFSFHPHTSHSGSIDYHQEAPVQLTGALLVSGHFYFYKDPDLTTPPADDGKESDRAGIHIGIGPYLRGKADDCRGTVDLGGQITIGAVLRLFHHDLVDASHDFDLGSKQIYKIDWRNCAIWSGSISYAAHVNWVSSDGTSTFNVNASANLTVNSPNRPPVYDIYTATASGSGSQVQTSTTECLTPPMAVTNKDQVNWAGAITVSGKKPTVVISKAGARTWAFSLSPPTSYVGMTTSATETNKTYADNPCHAIITNTSYDDWWQYVFSLANPGISGPSDSFTFSMAAGASEATGKIIAPASGTQPKITITYDLTRKCTMGGTDC